jgi:hypothetical protein
MTPSEPSVHISSEELFRHIQAVANAVSWLDYENADKALVRELKQTGEFLCALYELQDVGGSS